MPNTTLWPPLKQIEAALNAGDFGGFAQPFHRPEKPSDQKIDSDALPSASLSAAGAPSSALVVQEACDWRSGVIVLISCSGVKANILLDRRLQDHKWVGWVCAGETSWAGAFDVLLEPEDEPFDPGAGVVQTWNPIELEWSAEMTCERVAELSAQRMNAIRAVAKEAEHGLLINIPAEPGRIALRTAGGAFLVLTGTPLGRGDVRQDYQAAYLSLSARLITQQLTDRISLKHQEPTIEEPPVAVRYADFEIKLKPHVRLMDVQPLLRATQAYIISGPDSFNRYGIRSSNVSVAKVIFTQSVLIDEVFTG